MMRRGWARPALALLATAALVATPAAVRVATGTAAPRLTGVELVMPPGADTLGSITPTFVIRVRDPQPADRPITLRLQIAFTPGFTGQFVYDTTVIGDTAAITPARPLPSGATVFVRASAQAANGELVFSPSFQRVVPPWLVLVSPNDLNGSTLETQRPRFTWRSARISDASGPWLYDLQIRNVATGQILFYSNLSDTSFVPPVGSSGLPLEFNTSYRWSVTARIPSGESVTVGSRSSFVILNPSVPLATLLYQNFPNPFPTATSTSTCVWFDLSVPALVRLDVFDLSGRHVANIIPGAEGPSQYQAGRHGRVAAGSASGCNGNVQWDGRGSDGAFVPPGVYLLRLRAGTVASVKKIVFRGRP
jgi:hypothetical protein